MADMKKCDRCGHIYDKPAGNFENKVITTYISSRSVEPHDLCSGCTEDLVRFLKNEYVDRRLWTHD